MFTGVWGQRDCKYSPVRLLLITLACSFSSGLVMAVAGVTSIGDFVAVGVWARLLDTLESVVEVVAFAWASGVGESEHP